MKTTSFIHFSLKNSNIFHQLNALGEVVLFRESNITETDEIAIKDSLFSSSTIKSVLARANDSETVIFLTQDSDIELSPSFANRISESNAMMIYSDYEIERTGNVELTDYQKGSIRDGFKFGPLLVFKWPTRLLSLLAESDYTYGGLYDLVLRINENERPHHICDRLYKVFQTAIDNRKSGEKQFDYLDIKNRDLQIEFEQVATRHLKRIGAFIDHKELREIEHTNATNNVTASVVIPVYNRERTIKDAVVSALNQKTSFPFNVIVVDNHSTDKTTSILKEISKEDNRLIHIIPTETDLRIGGCWNKALCDPHCGTFAIQLDSDDIYSDEKTVETIVNKFREEKCAMVIGSYRITNFKLETLPPGIIDHKEWTPTNGMNNALRINGLGAPRAFYTPLARQILFPNCSYGEDYAMGLAVSRQFKIGRIYDVLYICRRWEGNSDADLTQEKQNANDTAKDFMRTQEIEKRVLLNKL